MSQKTINYDAFKRQLSYLKTGENTYKETCPHCGVGGGSFSVRRIDNGLLYHCFRASCVGRGFVPTTLQYGYDYQKPSNSFTPKTFNYRTQELTDAQLDFFFKKFELSNNSILQAGFKYSPDVDRIVIPVLSPTGVMLGNTARWWEGVCERPLQSSKTIHYIETQAWPFVYFGRWVTSRDVIYVEDPISAIKVGNLANNATVIGLLGTNVSNELLRIRSGGTLTLWLDADAETKAHKLYKDLQWYFDDIKIVTSPKDPKDTPINAILDVLYSQ